jgi:hypothetical protein
MLISSLRYIDFVFAEELGAGFARYELWYIKFYLFIVSLTTLSVARTV